MNKKIIFRRLLSQNFSKRQISTFDLSRADLSRADLSGADLSGADLSEADLSEADLSEANLSGANLSRADLSRADVSRANLSGANLSGADLSEADLSEADLSGADLSGADLSGANLSEANLNEYTFGLTLNCPEKGSFIGYKKCKNNMIVTLLILENAKRSSGTSYKCRCDKVKVLEIENGLQEISSNYDKTFIYHLGEIKTSNFDENRWNECSEGIHFFMSKELAKQF